MSAALVLALVLTASNDPYNRSRVDPFSQDSHCLWWDQKELVFHANEGGNPDTRGETEYEALRRSIASWNSAAQACGHLTMREGARTAEKKIGVETAGGTDRNLVVYRQTSCSDVVPASDACWADETCMNLYDCWLGSRATIGLTTTTFETRTGRIFDADIELNAAWFVFTTVDSPPCVSPNFNQGCVATDVENTLTHELGHALGLDHTTFPGSTMNPTAPGGETAKRNLDTGSKRFVCETYPVNSPPRDCVIISAAPPNELGGEAGCFSGGSLAVLGMGLGAVLAGRRRRHWSAER